MEGTAQQRSCRSCSRSLADQASHHWLCRACWREHRFGDAGDAGPADRLLQHPGQLSLSASYSPEPEPVVEPESESPFCDWLDQQQGAA